MLSNDSISEKPNFFIEKWTANNPRLPKAVMAKLTQVNLNDTFSLLSGFPLQQPFGSPNVQYEKTGVSRSAGYMMIVWHDFFKPMFDNRTIKL